MSDRETNALVELLGSNAVSTDPADLDGHASDWSPRALVARRAGSQIVPPLAVVRPANSAAVSRLLEWATESHTPIVPFGGGSSVVEGIAAGGSVVVDLSPIDHISTVDVKSRLVTAGAGVTSPRLREALAADGYMLGHEPQSHDISTVGGWVATRACGQLSARFGGIEDLVAGLEAVLGDGRLVRSKVAPRRSTGPDLASLLLGSEGTLGIITEVTLRISPIVEEQSDACVRFEHMADGIVACRALAQSRLDPTVVRLYDREDAFLFTMAFDDPPVGPLLLMSFDGPGAQSRSDAAVELSAGKRLGNELVEHWWSHRNATATMTRPRLRTKGGGR